MAEAKVSLSRTIVWLTLCSCVATSPTRRQFVAITETTSHHPAAVVTNDGTAWDDSDDFDLDEDDWLNHARAASPSSFPARRDYDEYDEDDDDYATMHNGKVMVDLGDDEEVTEHQDAEEDDDDHQQQNDSEFLFLPPRDTRLVLEDDDDPSGPIKVRHTGRSSYPRIVDSDNSVEDSEEDKEEGNRPFEFTIDDDDEDKERDDDDGDFAVEESHEKDDDSVEVLPNHKVHEDEEDDFGDDSDGDEEHMFENPEEEAAQVIYGDHVFLY